jgi:hypothetical protein
MGMVFTPSADKHSIPRDDALHAIYNAVFTSTNVKASADQPLGRDDSLLELNIIRRIA